MSDADAERFEQELFADPDAPEVRWLDAAAAWRRTAKREGRIRWGSRAELVITRVEVDVGDADRVDTEIEIPGS